MQVRVQFAVLFILMPQAVLAQFDPAGAQVISYFPHLADGGAAAQQWQTSITLLNPHVSIPAAAQIAFLTDNGSPLQIDFGNGPTTGFTFVVPPMGVVTYRSTAKSSTTVTGWAVVVSTMPLSGVLQFKFSINGVPQQGVSAPATAAALRFHSPATASTGLAVVNPYSNPVTINATAVDQNGNSLGATSVSLGPSGHQSFTMSQLFPKLPSGFQGSIVLDSTAVATGFVAWTLSSDGGVISSYPQSGVGWPVSQYERIYRVWEKVLNAAISQGALTSPFPQLVINYSTGQINAFADPTHNQVDIYINLAELISDSESELAFVAGHELGHIIQAKTSRLVFSPNIEIDADQYGMLLGLIAGYDPYGAAGALAKLEMASGTAGLLNQNFDNLLQSVGADLHGSFDNRLALIFQNMQQICGTAAYEGFCSLYKSEIHPHLPSIAPLAASPVQR